MFHTWQESEVLDSEKNIWGWWTTAKSKGSDTLISFLFMQLKKFKLIWFPVMITSIGILFTILVSLKNKLD